MGDKIKPDHLVPPACSGCGGVPTLITKRRRVRRGARGLDVDGWLWECARCDDPFTGERPYRFADPSLLRWDDEQARRRLEANVSEITTKLNATSARMRPELEPEFARAARRVLERAEW